MYHTCSMTILPPPSLAGTQPSRRGPVGKVWPLEPPHVVVHPSGGKSAVVVAGLQEVMVVTDSDDLAVVEDDNLVRGLHGGEPVGNGHKRALPGHLLDRPAQRLLV